MRYGFSGVCFLGWAKISSTRSVMSATRILFLIFLEPMGYLMQEFLVFQNWRLCGQHMSIDQDGDTIASLRSSGHLLPFLRFRSSRRF